MIEELKSVESDLRELSGKIEKIVRDVRARQEARGYAVSLNSCFEGENGYNYRQAWFDSLYDKKEFVHLINEFEEKYAHYKSLCNENFNEVNNALKEILRFYPTAITDFLAEELKLTENDEDVNKEATLIFQGVIFPNIVFNCADFSEDEVALMNDFNFNLVTPWDLIYYIECDKSYDLSFARFMGRHINEINYID